MAKGLGVVAAAFWVVTLLAAVDMAYGSPTAINGVVAAGIGAVVMTWAARELRREDRPGR